MCWTSGVNLKQLTFELLDLTKALANSQILSFFGLYYFMVGDDARAEQIIFKVLTLEAHKVVQNLLVKMLMCATLESRASDFVR